MLPRFCCVQQAGHHHSPASPRDSGIAYFLQPSHKETQYTFCVKISSHFSCFMRPLTTLCNICRLCGRVSPRGHGQCWWTCTSELCKFHCSQWPIFTTWTGTTPSCNHVQTTFHRSYSGCNLLLWDKLKLSDMCCCKSTSISFDHVQRWKALQFEDVRHFWIPIVNKVSEREDQQLRDTGVAAFHPQPAADASSSHQNGKADLRQATCGIGLNMHITWFLILFNSKEGKVHFWRQVPCVLRCPDGY